MEELDDELGDIQVRVRKHPFPSLSSPLSPPPPFIYLSDHDDDKRQAAIKDREDAMLRALAKRVLEEEVRTLGGGKREYKVLGNWC